jgi:putative transposase
MKRGGFIHHSTHPIDLQSIRFGTALTDAPWKWIEPYVPKPKPGGRPPKYPRREIVNAILDPTRNGCLGRALPHDLPADRAAFHDFRAWQRDGTWDRIPDALREKVRRAAGKKPKPTAAIRDRQSVKTTEQGGPRGIDAGKKNQGPQAVRGG